MYVCQELKNYIMETIIKNLEKAMDRASQERRAQLINLIQKLKKNV